jgi:hypothetical protein
MCYYLKTTRPRARFCVQFLPLCIENASEVVPFVSETSCVTIQTLISLFVVCNLILVTVA